VPSNKTNKDFLATVLRRAFITKEDSYTLYEMIHDEVVQALAEGKDVNLFDLVYIEAAEKKAHRRNSFDGMIEVPDKTVLKPRLSPALLKEWKMIND
jgi:nucleoid DNA-binding protein